jgi:multiple sugar transport system substrate-binding protein
MSNHLDILKGVRETMSGNTLKSFVMLAVVFALVLAACAPAETPAPTEEPAPEPTEAPAAEPTEEPMPEVDPTGQTVIFWHVWGTGLPNETMLAIVDEFNANNEWDITVEALDQGSYSDLEDAFNAAVQSGDLPDLVTGYTNAMANWYAVDAVVDMSPYIDDPFFGLSAEEKAAFFEGALGGGRAPDGTLFAFPISQSENVLFYNSGWAKELGFENPPTNYEEFKAQACAAAEANNNDDDPDNDGTGGLVLYAGASNVASFVFANGGNMLNAAGDGYDYTDQTVVDVAEFWKDLWDSGCAFPTESYPNAAFEAEDAIQDEWTIAPFPGKDGGQSVDLYGQYVAIANTNPERMMATWVFLKYLTSPEAQAKWIEGSAYYPTRSDTLPLIEAYGAENEIWSYGLSFLDYGKAEPAWASWTTVRRDVGDSFNAILQGSPDDIPTLLEELNGKAEQAIEELE